MNEYPNLKNYPKIVRKLIKKNAPREEYIKAALKLGKRSKIPVRLFKRHPESFQVPASYLYHQSNTDEYKAVITHLDDNKIDYNDLYFTLKEDLPEVNFYDVVEITNVSLPSLFANRGIKIIEN